MMPMATRTITINQRVSMLRFINTRIMLEILASVIFGFFLSGLPHDLFIDRDNYLLFISAETLFERINIGISSPLVFFANEPLWVFLNLGLAILFEADTVIRLIIFLGAATFCCVVLRHLRGGPTLYLFGCAALLLLTPQILKNYVVHLRQGFAIAVFMLILFDFPSYWRLGLAAIIAALFHSSFFFIFGLAVVLIVLEHFQLKAVYKFSIIAIFIFISAYFLNTIYSIIEVRRGDPSPPMEVLSGNGFVFWISVLLVVCIAANIRRDFEMNHYMEFAITAILLYLIYYFSTMFASRIFESALPLVYLGLLTIPGITRKLISAALGLLLVYQWLPALAGNPVFTAPP